MQSYEVCFSFEYCFWLIRFHHSSSVLFGFSSIFNGFSVLFSCLLLMDLEFHLLFGTEKPARTWNKINFFFIALGLIITVILRFQRFTDTSKKKFTTCKCLNESCQNLWTWSLKNCESCAREYYEEVLSLFILSLEFLSNVGQEDSFNIGLWTTFHFPEAIFFRILSLFLSSLFMS